MKIKNINLTGINMVLYSLLVVATPFIMLQNYLQGFIRHLSGAHIGFAGISVPTVLILFSAFLIVMLIVFRKAITPLNLLAPVLVIALIAVGQWISDYYIDFKYYDLQNNWHHFAYFLFAFIAWSFFKNKAYPLHRMLIYTWLLALGISLFDELFQHGMSQRVFDLSDVAKDLWGTTIGLLVVVFWLEKTSIKKAKIRQDNRRGYFTNPLSLMALLFILSFMFLLVSSLLTEKRYAGFMVAITFLFTGIIFLIIHNFRGWRKKLVLALIGILLAGQIALLVVNRNRNFIFHNNFLSIYNGWCLPFFDVIIFPDKTFRFVDKKVEFNKTDKQVLMKSEPDIIIVGAGENSEGGNGFPLKENTHFILNPNTKKPVQVIVLDSRSACLKYNELSRKNLKTVMVLHKSI